MVCYGISGVVNRPFAVSHSRGTKPPCWRARVALGQDKQKTYIILIGNFLCLSCPSATFAPQHGSFVPGEWLAANGLFPLSLSSGLEEIALIAMDRKNDHTANKNKQSKHGKLYFIEHSSEYLQI